MIFDHDAALRVVRPCADYFTDSGCEPCAASVAHAMMVVGNLEEPQ